VQCESIWELCPSNDSVPWSDEVDCRSRCSISAGVAEPRHRPHGARKGIVRLIAEHETRRFGIFLENIMPLWLEILINFIGYAGFIAIATFNKSLDETITDQA
jgi:hypothetical protein